MIITKGLTSGSLSFARLSATPSLLTMPIASPLQSLLLVQHSYPFQLSLFFSFFFASRLFLLLLLSLLSLLFIHVCTAFTNHSLFAFSLFCLFFLILRFPTMFVLSRLSVFSSVLSIAINAEYLCLAVVGYTMICSVVVYLFIVVCAYVVRSANAQPKHSLRGNSLATHHLFLFSTFMSIS